MNKKYFGFGIWLTVIAITGVVSHYILEFTLMDTLVACAIAGIISSLVIIKLRKEKPKFETHEINLFILTAIIVITIVVISGFLTH